MERADQALEKIQSKGSGNVTALDLLFLIYRDLGQLDVELGMVRRLLIRIDAEVKHISGHAG